VKSKKSPDYGLEEFHHQEKESEEIDRGNVFKREFMPEVG
jgi:hypothetical protein